MYLLTDVSEDIVFLAHYICFEGWICEGKIMNNKVASRKRICIWIAILCGVAAVLGFVWSSVAKQQGFGEAEDLVEDLSYGVIHSNLTVTDVVWKDYPGWKTVSFQVTGDIAMKVPSGAEIRPEGLNDEEVCEMSRKTMQSYDMVSLQISQSMAEGKVIETKELDGILQAANGYHWKVSWEAEDGTTGDTIIGCILPASEQMQFWTEEENQYAERNLQPYFDAFRMSRTYTNDTAQTTKVVAEGIVLKKREGGVFCFELTNTSQSDWFYSPVMPELELWYDGVWLEVVSPYGDAGVASCCKAGETISMDKPECEEDYPYLFPGMYRLVQYGVDDDCVISDVFEVQ